MHYFKGIIYCFNHFLRECNQAVWFLLQYLDKEVAPSTPDRQCLWFDAGFNFGSSRLALNFSAPRTEVSASSYSSYSIFVFFLYSRKEKRIRLWWKWTLTAFQKYQREEEYQTDVPSVMVPLQRMLHSLLWVRSSGRHLSSARSSVKGSEIKAKTHSHSSRHQSYLLIASIVSSNWKLKEDPSVGEQQAKVRTSCIDFKCVMFLIQKWSIKNCSIRMYQTHNDAESISSPFFHF